MMEKSVKMKAVVVLWDRDIVWGESLKRRLQDKGFPCEEIDSREEFGEMLRRREDVDLYVASEESLLEAGLTIGEMVVELKIIDRLKERKTGVVLVVEKDEKETELNALRAGALEVIFKNRETEIAAERIDVLLRLMSKSWGVQTLSEEERLLSFQYDFWGIYLTELEKKVLYEMYCHLNQVVSREKFVEKFWEGREKKEFRVVDTVVKQIRKKIKNTRFEIQGIYGIGYLLKE